MKFTFRLPHNFSRAFSRMHLKCAGDGRADENNENNNNDDENNCMNFHSEIVFFSEWKIKISRIGKLK